MIGVVCAGAGARGAYEAGALSVLLPRLLHDFPDEPIVLVGTSAGAINAVLYSGVLDRDRPPEVAVHDALRLWSQAKPSQVFTGLRSTAPRLAVRYGLELAGFPVLDSLLDSSPLRRTLADEMDWARLHANLAGAGRIHAAAVAATDCTDGGTRVFLEGRIRVPPPDTGEGLAYRSVALEPVHVQASAAIPVAFLPVEIQEEGSSAWFVDGGVRLNAPIKPALEFGGDRIVVVATTPGPESPQYGRFAGENHDVFSVALVALRSLLIDRMAADVRRLRQVNSLVAAAGVSQLSASQRGRPYVRVPNLYVGPHEPDALGNAARRVFDRYYTGPAGRLSDLGVLAALLGGIRGDHAELFSFLFFDGRYHRVLIDMGRRDAERALSRGWR